MSGPEFFQTRMGQKFYTSDVPRIAEALEKIAKALEKQNELNERPNDPLLWPSKKEEDKDSSGGE